MFPKQKPKQDAYTRRLNAMVESVRTFPTDRVRARKLEGEAKALLPQVWAKNPAKVTTFVLGDHSNPIHGQLVSIFNRVNRGVTR